MGQSEHSKIINKVAKQILSPYGIVRKGQSRTWHDDNGWFTTIIEFQPSGFSKGTYLNVGVNLHWSSQDYWSFDYGYREESFVDFENEHQFIPEIEKMAQIALDKTLFYRNLFRSIDAAKDTLLMRPFSVDDLWGNYHKGIVCGLKGNKTESEKYFNSLLSVEHNYQWANELKARVHSLVALLNETEKFKQAILSIIKETRKLKKLKEIEIAL